MVEIIVYSFHEFLMRRFLPVSLYPCAKVEGIRERNPAMFTIVVPPDYTEELQQICGLDASQREKLMTVAHAGLGNIALAFSCILNAFDVEEALKNMEE